MASETNTWRAKMRTRSKIENFFSIRINFIVNAFQSIMHKREIIAASA